MQIAAMYGKPLEMAGGNWDRAKVHGKFHHAVFRIPCRCDGYIGSFDDVPILSNIYD